MKGAAEVKICERALNNFFYGFNLTNSFTVLMIEERADAEVELMCTTNHEQTNLKKMFQVQACCHGVGIFHYSPFS